jgi:hypothetical protein
MCGQGMVDDKPYAGVRYEGCFPAIQRLHKISK